MNNSRKSWLGGVVWILGSLIFVAGMIIAQLGYGPSSYSLILNHISDLGAIQCATLSGPTGGSDYLYNGTVCSPWHDAFNLSIIIDGILLVLGVLLVQTSFPLGNKSTTGLGLLTAAGIGSIGVGLFPEDTNFLAHSFSAALVFVAGNIAIVILGAAMSGNPKWTRYRNYSILSGAVGLVAFLLFLFMLDGSLGVGGMERLIIGPILLWTLIVGINLIHFRTLSSGRDALRNKA